MSFDLDKIRNHVVLSFMRNMVAFEFNTKEELKKYLDEHPDADRSLHWVKSPNKGKKGHEHPFIPKHKLAPEGVPVSLHIVKETDEAMKQAVISSTKSIYGKSFDSVKDLIKSDRFSYPEMQKFFDEFLCFFPGRSVVKQFLVDKTMPVSSVETFFRSFTGSKYSPSPTNCAWSEIVRDTFGQKGEDYRIKQGKPGSESYSLSNYNEIKDKSEVLSKQLRNQMAKEQAILIAAGLVDEEGYIMVYRSAKHYNGNVGDDVDIEGNFIDSWTLNPNVSWSGRKVAARVPVSRVLASYVGRSHEGYEWTHMNENEVILNSFDGLKGKIYGHNKFTTYEQMQIVDELKDAAKGVPFNDMPWPQSGISNKFTTIKTLSGGKSGAKIVTDGEGHKLVVKDYSGDTKQVENDYIASSLYNILSFGNSDITNIASKLVTIDGKKWVSTPFYDGSKPINLETIKQKGPAIGTPSAFVLDALLANGDAVGENGKNILDAWGSSTNIPHSYIKIGFGGALDYNGDGTPKGDAFGTEVKELESFRDPKSNETMAALYGHLTDKQIADDILKFYKLMKDRIDKINPQSYNFSKQFIPIDNKEKLSKLHSKLLSRLDYMKEWAEKVVKTSQKQTLKPETLKVKLQEKKQEAIPVPNKNTDSGWKTYQKRDDGTYILEKDNGDKKKFVPASKEEIIADEVGKKFFGEGSSVNQSFMNYDGKSGFLKEIADGYIGPPVESTSDTLKKSALLGAVLLSNPYLMGKGGNEVYKSNKGLVLGGLAHGLKNLTTDVSELDDYRDKSKNPQLARLNMSDKEIAEYISNMGTLVQSMINKIKYGAILSINNMAEEEKLHSQLSNRWKAMQKWSEDVLSGKKTKKQNPVQPEIKPEPETKPLSSPPPKAKEVAPPVVAPAPEKKAPVQEKVKAPEMPVEQKKFQKPVPLKPVPVVEPQQPQQKVVEPQQQKPKTPTKKSQLSGHQAILDYYELDGGAIEGPLTKFKSSMADSDKKLSPGKTKMNFISKLDPNDFQSKADFELAKKSLVMMSPIDFDKLFKAIK